MSKILAFQWNTTICVQIYGHTFFRMDEIHHDNFEDVETYKMTNNVGIHFLIQLNVICKLVKKDERKMGVTRRTEGETSVALQVKSQRGSRLGDGSEKQYLI